VWEREGQCVPRGLDSTVSLDLRELKQVAPKVGRDIQEDKREFLGAGLIGTRKDTLSTERDCFSLVFCSSSSSYCCE